MYNFVHLFIGKEFEQIVMKMGRATLRNSGSSAASFIGYYLVDKLDKASISCRKLAVNSCAPEPVLEGFEDYTDIQWEDPQKGSLPEVFSEMYANVLGGNNVEDADRLYICVHVPLYKPQSIDSLKLIYSAFLNLRMPMTMMFVGYGDDLSRIIEPSFKIESPSSVQVRQFMKMKNAQEISVSTHMFVIQNTFSNGIPLNLDESALAEVMSLFAIVTSGYYKQMFPPTVDYKDIISFGLTALNMDRYLFVEYMLNKVLLHAIDKSRMMVKKVSVNDAFDRALEIVNEKDSVLSKLLAEYDNGDHQNFQQTCNELAAEADTIVSKAATIFERDNDVTMQAATLAALLSKNECELFTNIIYDPQKSSMNDLLMEPIEYFRTNDVAGFYAEEGEPVVNPIPRIKDLNSLIINSEAEVRNLQEELKTFGDQMEDVSKMGDAVFQDDCIVVNNRKYRLLPAKKEELLEETYTPKETKTSSVDLTAEFRPIQNQGAQGSCVAFSLTSVFEYAVKLNTKETLDLSEAFLYYNSRMIDQGEGFDPTLDEGTTFTSAIRSLSEFGLAEESFCKYDQNVCHVKPSDEAYENAKVRKLIKALNVDRTVSAVKSAVAEGYPVVASFTLCPSFNPSSNGLISMPDQAELDALENGTQEKTMHNRHGMVIVGYDDKLRSFLVRNSWGADWGNKGYCYIPYEYIEHEHLFNFACIITEIQSLPIVNVRKTVEMKVDDTDIAIRYHLCKIAKDQEEKNLESFKNERNLLMIYLEKIKRDFSNPNKTEQFIAVTNVKKEEEKELLVKGKKDLQRRLDEENENYSLFKKRTIFLAIAVPVLFFLGILFNNFLAKPVIFNTMTYQRYEEVPSKLADTPLVVEEPFLYYFVGSLVEKAPQTQMSFLEKAAGYAAVGVLAPVSIITGDLSLDMHFARVRSIGIMSIIPIAGVLILILFFIARSRWNEWRETKVRLEEGINRKTKEIAGKQKEIDNFRAKTHYAREWLRLLGDIQNRFQQRYTKLIFLINTMREKYVALQEYEQTKDLGLDMPFTSLLDKEKLDKYFEEFLSDDEICDVDFCENIENYQIDESYVKQYVKKLTLTIQQRMAEHRDVAEFRIHDHIAHDSGAKIAMAVKNTLRVEDGEISLPNLIRRSGPFFHTNSITRGVIPDMTYTFMPEGGNADFVLENPYLAIFMKAACIECDECVMFQKKNDKK